MKKSQRSNTYHSLEGDMCLTYGVQDLVFLNSNRIDM